MRAHPDVVGEPARIRFTHVYVGRDRHGARLADDAAALLADLQRGAVPPDAALRRGDPFPAGSTVGPLALEDLGRRFGTAFAAALADAPPGRWIGPVASTFGLHLVWIHEQLPARMPALDEVRGQVVHHLLRERGAASVRERLAALRAGAGAVPGS
jgi:parvulin-like peptidyl-prolyl isomerase